MGPEGRQSGTGDGQQPDRSPTGRPRRRPALGWVVAAVLVLGACTEGSSPELAATAAPTTRPEPPLTPTVAPMTPPTTTAERCTPATSIADDGSEPVPESLTATLAAQLADPRWADVEASVSIWIDGYGEVAHLDPDRQLFPASNQKLLTAIGAHLLLDPDHRFETSVAIDTNRDLTLVAGGDPTLSATGDHSLASLATAVADAGIATVGDVVVDASRFERRLSMIVNGERSAAVVGAIDELIAAVVADRS